MKKMIVVLLLISSVLLCSCVAKVESKASSKALSVAKQAIQVLDGYLDGTTNNKECINKLKELNDQLDYVHGNKSQMSDEETADWQISARITAANHKVLMDGTNGNAATYQEVIDARNELAKIIGEKSR